MSRTVNGLHFKTFDQLMSGVESDIDKFTDEGYVNRGNFIKEVRKVNADLGLKINVEREDMLEVKDYVALLPGDFLFMQLALACHVSYVRVPNVMGAQTEVHTIDREVELPNRSCTLNSCEGKCDGPCNNCLWISQKVGVKVYTFTDIKTLQLTKSSVGRCADNCLNFHFKSPHQIRIEDDHANFSFREGKVYINYLADMVDEDNNVIILDHPLVNDYYEYAIKKKFFENMMLNKEGDFAQSWQAMDLELTKARSRAISFVNQPEYGDLQKMYVDNRNRFYKKYVRYFDDHKQGIFEGENHGNRNNWFNRNGQLR